MRPPCGPAEYRELHEMDNIISAGRNIVNLFRYQGKMEYPALKQVEAYWQALRHEHGNNGAVPRRAQIDPRGIDRALHQAFILERIAPGLARIRIGGMHLADLMGMEVRGMPFTALFTPAARRRISEVLETVFSAPCCAEIALTAEKGIGRPALSARALLLPLRSDLGDVTRILGCLASTGRIGRTPRRFDMASVELVRIDGKERGFVPAMGFAERPAPFAAGMESGSCTDRRAETPRRRRAHLRLVKSDD